MRETELMGTMAVALTEQSLPELAATANREHGLALAAAASTINHAIAAGEALWVVKRTVAPSEWTRWTARHFSASHATACGYMRVARQQDLIRACLGEPSLGEALRFLRGGNALPPIGGSYPPPQETVAECRRLAKEEGLTYNQIAPLVGLSSATVRKHLDPAARRRYTATAKRKRAEDRAARKAARQEVRAAAVSKVGGSVAGSYSMIRKTLGALDGAHSEAVDREVKAALSSAMAKLYAAEDEIVRALGIE